jgi:hypothetical protein
MVFSKLACSKRQWKVDVDFPPVGWIGADSTLYRDGKANNVFAVILEPATQLPPAECCWAGLRDLDECTCFRATIRASFAISPVARTMERMEPLPPIPSSE